METEQREGGKGKWDGKGVYKEDRHRLIEEREVRQRRHVNNEQKDKGQGVRVW